MVGDQHAVARMAAPPDPAPQLVQLCDAEVVGIQHHHHSGLGDVHPHLHHSRGNQHVKSAVAEGLHYRVLLVGLHAPVQQADGEVSQLAGRQFLIDRLGGGGLHLLRFVYQRTDHERAVSGGRLLADQIPSRVDLLGAVRDTGEDGLAAGWQFVEHGHVQVAVDSHGRRARDRGGRHHQHVGDGAVGIRGAERGSLLDSEAVLLIDHRHAERGELDGALDEGVGTDHDVH